MNISAKTITLKSQEGGENHLLRSEGFISNIFSYDTDSVFIEDQVKENLSSVKFDFTTAWLFFCIFMGLCPTIIHLMEDDIPGNDSDGYTPFSRNVTALSNMDSILYGCLSIKKLKTLRPTDIFSCVSVAILYVVTQDGVSGCDFDTLGRTVFALHNLTMLNVVALSVSQSNRVNRPPFDKEFPKGVISRITDLKQNNFECLRTEKEDLEKLRTTIGLKEEVRGDIRQIQKMFFSFNSLCLFSVLANMILAFSRITRTVFVTKKIWFHSIKFVFVLASMLKHCAAYRERNVSHRKIRRNLRLLCLECVEVEGKLLSRFIKEVDRLPDSHPFDEKRKNDLGLLIYSIVGILVIMNQLSML